LHGFVFAGDLTALKYFTDLKTKHKKMIYTIMFIFIVSFLRLPRLNSIRLPDGGRELNTVLAAI
jgi:hypothetical protein